jgi:hypothetical protein
MWRTGVAEGLMVQRRRGVLTVITLRDPPQLSCLLVGELPGFPDERRLRDRRPSIDLLWEVLALKLSRVRGLVVRHGVPRSR